MKVKISFINCRRNKLGEMVKKKVRAKVLFFIQLFLY